MVELRTLGGLSIEANGVPPTGAAAQRKTLALLALLARHPRGLSRDKLIAYLWPENDAAHGRSLLRQACYALRRDLDEDKLLLGSTELRLNPAAVTSDVQAFDDALQHGELAHAADRYGGPFLDGFYLSEAGEFERWVSAERAQLVKQCSDLLATLAKEAAARGDHRAAADWWRRLTALDPLSSQGALGLMTALVAAGESAEAIKHARAHEAFLEQETGTAPDAAILTLVKQLCREAEPHASPPGAAAQQHKGRQSTTDFLLAALPPALRLELRRATRLSAAAAVAAIVLAVGAVGYGVAGRHATGGGPEPVPVANRKMLAVLPFQNLGSPDDDYFADGLSEAIATRLGSVRSLGVIAWSSAGQYKRTGKSPEEIGRELGVQYLLQGSVRRESHPGVSRVRVTPALIRVADGAQLWADQYDTTLSGVFAVQTNLATRVAGALDIAVVDAERGLLEARPTANLQAYDLYLRGRELVERELDRVSVRTAAHLYERAVALDSTFALAWAWLSVTYVWMHDDHMDRSPQQLTRAKAALDRTLRLAPDLPEAHCALGFYYFHVVGDRDRALEEFARARRGRPTDPNHLGPMGDIYATQGRWDEQLALAREAAALDPRNVGGALHMGLLYSERRLFAAATYYYDRALALEPQSVDAQLGQALAYLNQTADLAGAQRRLPELAEPVDPSGLKLPIVSLSDVATLLDAGGQARLLTLAPPAFDGDSVVLALTKALVLRASGRAFEARAQFDSARTILEVKARLEPDDEYYRALLGLALAGLGRSADANREGKRAVDLMPFSKDAEENGYMRANLARVYVLLSEGEKAIDELEYVLSRPGPLSVNWLKADPFWDPLRGSPRFQQLVAVRN